MRLALSLASLALVAACVSEQDSCVSNASRDLTIVNQLIAETRANVSRGYALEERTDMTTIEKVCEIVQDGGGILRVPCNEMVPNRSMVPVAIDLVAEQAKLDSLLARQPQMQAQANAAIEQCRLYYPDS